MAAPVADWANATTATATTGNSIDLSKPTGAATDDLCLIFVGNDSQTGTAQWDDSTLKPSGFTLIRTGGDTGTDAKVAAFGRVLDGTEGATFTCPAQSTVDYWGACVIVTHADDFDSSWLDVAAASATLDTTNTTSHTVPEVTTTAAETLAFAVLAFDGGDGPTFSTSSSGWTMRQTVQAGTGAANASGCVADKGLTSAGATGDCVITSAVSDGSAQFQFAVAPAAAAGNTGTVAVTLAGVSSAASATQEHTGTVSQTLAGATSAAAGGQAHAGSVAVTVDGVSSAASGTVANNIGSVAVTLAGVTSAASGGQEHSGSVSVTLAGVSCAGSGTVTSAASSGMMAACIGALNG